MMLSYRKTTTNLYNSIYHHFSSFDLAAFSKQLAHLLKSGIPLLDALDLLQSKNKHPLQREMFVHIKTHIEKGSSIAQALSMYPVYFDTIFCQLVACGEQSGQLEKILLDISDKRKKISLFKKNVRQKLAYPTLVLALSFILLFIFILKIIPNFQQLFEEFNIHASSCCQFLFSASYFINQNLFFISISFCILCIYLSYIGYKKLTQGKLYKIPLIGSIIQQWSLSYIFHTLATLLKAGIPITQSLIAVSTMTNNKNLQIKLHLIHQLLAEGTNLTEAFEQTKLLPLDALHFIHLGEKSGCLDTMFGTLAHQFQCHVISRLGSLTTWLEPLFILGIGSMTTLLFTILYVPLFQLSMAF